MGAAEHQKNLSDEKTKDYRNKL